MTYAEFKEKFLPQLNDIRSFAGKIRLADQYLTRIGSGSGRVVYDVDGEKALKLAKNRKGIAQNEAEAGAGYYRDTQHIVAEIFDSADDDSWLIAEKAKKVGEKRIKELTGIPSLNDLFYFLRNQVDQNNGRGKVYSQSEEMEEFFWENEFSADLINFVVNYGQTVGDMGRPSTYGEVMRDGQPTIVLTDYGLNDEVYDTHYSPQRKQKYAMYELFQYADGNDDILSDAGNAKDIKYGMWAQMPYSVSDGDGVINEEFIDFVNNRDSYPDASVSGLPVLTDRFHECVNNIKNVMEAVDDKKKFYGNLLELQNYLIRRGFYNRDPLISEKYQINEDVPDVQAFSLDNRGYADKLADGVADKLGLSTPKFMGGGGYGFAYVINNNLVMKLTSDISEADAASKTMRGNPKYIADIHNLYKVIDTDTNQAFFVVMQENIKDKPIHQIRRNIEVINQIEPHSMGYEDIMTTIRKPKRFDYDEMLEFAKHILTDNPEATVNESDRKAAYQFFVGMMNIRKELLEFDIKSTDYITTENLGYKNGVLTFFDVGGYFGVNEPNIDDENIISLPENEIIDEKYDREVADKIASQVGNKLNLNPIPMTGGDFGVAYDIGNDKVLKITKDNSEAAENLTLIGKPLKYIAQPYNVFEIQTNNKDMPKTYAIILEKLDTNPSIERQYDRLEYAFNKILGVGIPDVIEHYLDEWDNPKVDKNKIDSYLRKNPQDAEFFGGLLRIAEESKSYDIKSMDYLNSSNLGYKKNGALGFFDVGFGDGFAKPDAEKMRVNVNEDGTSIYYTDDGVGADGFPPYNNSNIPPTINNNLDANASSQMYEDLEYNHVDDATKDEYVLTEEQLENFIFNDDLVIDVYKNPKSMKRMMNSVRGILDKEGNLYVINDNYHVIHNDFAEWLNMNGYPVDKNTYHNLHSTVPLQRFGDSNNFYLSESIRPDGIEENLENIVIILRKAKQKNPQYNYIVKNIENAEPNNDKPLVEDRKKSWVKGSKAVTVKQRCRLGGKGDGTSDACNQGDINNLEFSNLDEDVSLDSDFVDGWHRYDILHDSEVAGEMEVSTRDKYMILNKIMINPEHRGMGHANDAMKILTDYADKNNKILALTPDTVWGANKNKLINWYKSWGFVMNKGRNIDYQVRELMTRKPKMTEQSEYQKYSEKSGANDNRINNMHSKLDKLRADNDLKYLKPYLSSDEMELVYNDALTSHKYFNTGKNPYAGAHKLKTAAWEKLEKDNPQAYKEYVEKSDKLYNMFKAVQNFSKKKRFGLDKEFQSDEKYGMSGDVDANEVSHFTTTQNAISILRDGYFMEGDEGGVAFTTNKDLVKQRKPVFYHPQGDWYEGTTHRNLSTQFVLDFNKMKQDGIRYKRGNENIGTHGGEEEIRVYTKEYELPLHSYLKKVIFDPSKEKREELSQELIDVLKEKNIQHYVKNNEEQTMGKGLDEYYSSLVPRVDEGMDAQTLPFKEEVENQGGQIYVVGGTLRDEMLGRPSKDLDIVIRGIPEPELENILRKYGKVNVNGKTFAVTKFVPDGSDEEIDIALPRTEVSTGEGHKDFEIKADHRLPIEKDLERRDFTVNAIAKDMDGNIIDPFNGQEDLKANKIKITHPKSFRDDALRMLRAVRFASVLGFDIDPETYKLIRENANSVNSIAKERVQTELQKIAEQGDASKGAFLLKDTGLLRHMGVDTPLLVSNVWDNVNSLADFIYLLSHNAMSPIKFYMNNMRGDTEIVSELNGLIIGMDTEPSDNPALNRSVAHNMYLKDKTGKSLESKLLPPKLQITAQELLRGKYPKVVEELAINGHDIMNSGLKGKDIGKMQRTLLINVYADKVRNIREDLLNLLNQRKDDVKEGYDYYNDSESLKWNVNSGEKDIMFFVKEYDKWNGGYYTDPSRESVKQFLGAKFGDLVDDDKLNKNLYWQLIDREILNESVKKTEKVEYGALMLYLDIKNWNKITSVIEKDDIYKVDDEFGIETEPHVTILYGFYVKVDAEDVFNLYREHYDLKPIEFEVKGISIFENPDFDVVKLDVESKVLGEMNKLMRELPCKITYPEYHPHVTVAYVKKGCGKKYMKKFEKNRIMKGNKLVFSTKKEKKNSLSLNDTGVLNENQENTVLYSAVVLDDKSRTALIKIFSPMIPKDWKVIAHHQTINMGTIDDQFKELLGEEIELNVTGYAMDDKVMAAAVQGGPTTNKKPHITIAVNRAGGGKPVMSNNLTSWKPLGFPLKLTGKITEV